MDNHYLTASDHERYLDSLARSEALCADKLRHGGCKRWQCAECEKKKMLDACKSELAPYSRLLLNDKLEAAIDHVIESHPTLEETRERIERDRRIRRNAVIQANKDLNWEWFHSGGWIAVVAAVLVPIIVPIIGCMEWYL